MKNFIGIDLGTTNSVISTFDGVNHKIWKSPEQNDVTPSAIYIDRRGNKYVGQRAYNTAARNPQNAAIKFKRMMGTKSKIKFELAKVELTPEECSTEVLKTLYGYVPEEIRNEEPCAVITVPAAFNQMQRDATLEAAAEAGFSKVALMQEPVAAVMSIMEETDSDGIFLIYDLGGGTLDIAIAESINKHVNLLSHGGITMCGGADFDRLLYDNIVKPWLFENFELPEDFSVNKKYRLLKSLAMWAIEKAKIDLSASEESMITLTEAEIQMEDLNGEEIYLDIPITREEYMDLIKPMIHQTIEKVREVIEEAGLTAHEFTKIVFIGGPTKFKPLRDLISFKLGIAAGQEVDPMTAVAVGASIFAESLDWDSETRGRKARKASIQYNEEVDIQINYLARTPDASTKVGIWVKGKTDSTYEVQFTNLDTGWSSGRISFGAKRMIALDLPNKGDNHFEIAIYDTYGNRLSKYDEEIVISRTAAMIDSIPATNSIGIAVLDKINGEESMQWLIRKGDSLPYKGKAVFKAAKALYAGEEDAINFNLYEGEIDSPVTDNRSIGTFTVKGTDFEYGIIPVGADLICEYEILDSGNIILEVDVPVIGNAFKSGHNFYSRQQGQIDFSEESEKIKEEAKSVLERLERLYEFTNNEVLKTKIEGMQEILENADDYDIEQWQAANETILSMKKAIFDIDRKFKGKIRAKKLEDAQELVDRLEEEGILPRIKIDEYNKTLRILTQLMQREGTDFETKMDEFRVKIFIDMFNYNDSSAVYFFNQLTEQQEDFNDQRLFMQLVQQGNRCIQTNDMNGLRRVVQQLCMNLEQGSAGEYSFITNILRG